MGQITYKTVIANAIGHFNDIQTELYKLEAKRADGVTNITSPSVELVPTDEFDTIISGQLQLKAVGDITITQRTGTDVSKYATATVRSGSATPSATLAALSEEGTSATTLSSKYFSITPKASVGTAGWISSISNGTVLNYTVQEGSASTPTNSTALSSSSTSLSGTTLTVQASVTPSFTAGWIDEGVVSAGTVKIKGTVPTETKTASGSGTISPSSGKLLSSVSVPAGTIGSASVSGAKVSVSVTKAGWIGTQTIEGTVATGSVTATPSVAQNTYDGTSTTPLTTDILLTDAPSEGGYYKVEMDPSVSVAVTAGYIASNSGAAQSGETVNRFIKKGSVSDSSLAYGESATVSAGYYSSAVTVSNAVGAGKITATPSVAQNTYDGTSTTPLSTDILLTDAPSSGGYYKVEMDPSVGIAVNTAGYISSSVGTKTAASGTTLNKYIKKGSATVPSATQTGASATLSGTTITLSKSVTPAVTEGYITAGSAGTIKVSGTVPTETKTASGSGTINPTSGKLLSSVSVPAGTLGEAVVNGNTVSVAVTKAGWIGTSASASATIPTGTITTGTTDNSASYAVSEQVVPSGGYLYIGAGYYPNTQISLDSILGGADDSAITAALSNAGYLRSGYKAYTYEGTEITGTMADCALSSDYYTETNTGYGVVTGGTYVTGTRYIKKSGTVSSSGSVTTAPTVTISKSINSGITTSTTDTYSTGFSIAASVSETNGTVQTKYAVASAGWTPAISTTNGGTVSVNPTATNNYGTNYITKLTIPAGKTFGKYTSSTDYADGVTINGASGSIGTLYAGFGTSGYGDLYLRNAGATSYKKVATAGKLTTGTAKAPTSISGTGSTVSVSSGTVTLTKTVSVTPTVTEGWVASGTATNSAITLSGTIATTSLTTATAKSCTITNNSTAAAKSGDAAVVNDSASTYVLINAKSTGKASVETGYINAGSIDFAASDTARIPAVVTPSVESGVPTATLTLNSASTFDTDGDVTSAYTANQTATIGAVTVLNASTSYKDKYIIGTFTAKTKSGTATTTVGPDVTGTGVDEYLEALYKRMLGQPYTDVDPDAA